MASDVDRASALQPVTMNDDVHGRRAFCLRCGRWLVALSSVSTLLTHENNLAAQEWVDRRRIGSISIQSEVRLERFHGLLKIIEDQQADLASTLNLKLGDGLVEIRVLSSSRAYRSHVVQFAREGVDRRAVFVKGEDGVGRVFLYVHDAFETDLRHELTHALLHSTLPFIPLWLDEGIAEYFEVPAEQRASNHPHQARLKWSARLGWNPNMRRLESRETVRDMSATDYRESWAWVHFLLHGSLSRSDVLQKYLASIQRGEPPGPLSEHVARLSSNPASSLAGHIRSWK